MDKSGPHIQLKLEKQRIKTENKKILIIVSEADKLGEGLKRMKMGYEAFIAIPTWDYNKFLNVLKLWENKGPQEQRQNLQKWPQLKKKNKQVNQKNRTNTVGKGFNQTSELENFNRAPNALILNEDSGFEGKLSVPKSSVSDPSTSPTKRNTRI